MQPTERFPTSGSVPEDVIFSRSQSGKLGDWLAEETIR